MNLHEIYRESLILLTDFYQLSMAYGYWKSGMKDKEAVYHLHFRKNPFDGGYTIAAGLQNVVDFLSNFSFQPSDIDYLANLKNRDNEPFFSDDFLRYLSEMEFTCNIDAIPEGTVVFPQEPLIRVMGPLIQCQLLESPLLNLVNFPTLVATKGARVKMIAGEDEVIEFGMRRAQGIDGALTASRSAYLGGCDATSNVLAGKVYGIPTRGTHAHSWIMAFRREIDSFYAFADALPSNTIFLVDTYNTLDGVKNAIQVGKDLQKKGISMIGIRLDSGDLAYLSIEARKMLDEAGLTDAKIFASNELSEKVIDDLKKQGAKIDVWGVGTNLSTCKDQAALCGIYKLSAIRDPGEEWKFKLKLSEQMIKISNPGILQVRRFFTEKENVADVIYNEPSGIPDEWKIIDPLDPTREKWIDSTLKNYDLLVPVFRKGKCCYRTPPLVEIRQATLRNLGQFHPGIKRQLNPHQYPVGLEESLYQEKVSIIKKIRSKFQTNKIECEHY